ncbi:MAG TPA: ribosome small subunit-dependent GTPase A, partial [Ignavibacteria bacterium]|nr:ribosome small subunit-dependent GTPase A [Ignavibacteria bacterium]
VRAFPEENKAVIQKLLPRRSKFSRKEAGEKTKEQIVAANVDTVFLMTSLNQDFNIRRLERYIVLAKQSKADAVIILSKSDLCENVEDIIAEVKTVSKDIPVHVVSSLTGAGLDELREYFEGNKTITIMGSSGVGKSTFTNALLGYDKMKVKDTTEYKDKGLHTTTHRELVLLPEGGLIIDTPGMREIQLWESNDGIEEAFDEIEALMENCKFSDCSHSNEPGCAVLEALETGELDRDRYNSFLKLKRESQYFERRHNKKLQIDERKKWKAITKSVRKHNKYKR